MNNPIPNPEFEQKVRAAVAAPNAEPAFVRRLRGEILAASAATETHPTPVPFRGAFAMRYRMMIPALAVMAVIAVVAFFALSTFTPVSAQQILERATQAQTAAAAAPGIRHTRIESYRNFKALDASQAETTTVEDGYADPAGGRYRYVKRDAAGRIIEVSAQDGAYSYWGFADQKAGPQAALAVERTPLSDEQRSESAGAGDVASTGAFEQFLNNPRVRVLGKQTWEDGRQVYVLVDPSYHTEIDAGGQVGRTYTGSMTMVFDAQTYQWLASRKTIIQAGEEIVIEAVRYLSDETLPAESRVAWDLSDLQGVVMKDKEPDAPEEVTFEQLSPAQLAQRSADGYVLKTPPQGFRLEVVAAANQPQDQPYRFEVNYRGPDGAEFNLMYIDVVDAAFIQTNFYDGSYQAANGLVLHYSISGSDPSHPSTNAILALPNGNGYLLNSSLTREQVQALVEDLVPVK